jgi:hypothetical protein
VAGFVSVVVLVVFLWVECFFFVVEVLVFLPEASSFFIVSVVVAFVSVVVVDFAASSANAATERARIPAAARAMSFFKVNLHISRWVDEVGDD